MSHLSARQLVNIEIEIHAPAISKHKFLCATIYFRVQNFMFMHYSENANRYFTIVFCYVTVKNYGVVLDDQQTRELRIRTTRFSLSLWLHATTFILLGIFPPLGMVSIRIQETPMSWDAKCSLLIAVSVSKTLFPCLQSHLNTRTGGLGEFSKVMQTLETTSRVCTVSNSPNRPHV